MSGLASAARLSLYDKKVLVLEKHSIPGGLNSYYQRRNAELGGVRLFDVGLHALTNFAVKGDKGKPLTKLLKQLRISYDELRLKPQTHSLIAFPGNQLKFSNDFELLLSQIEKEFPHDLQSFCDLVQLIKNYNELDLKQPYQSARLLIGKFIKNPLLIEMLIAPLLIYGSAWEDDMDFSQFVIMFKSLYFEGFSRPEGGVRTILSLLMKTCHDRGVEMRFKTPVTKLILQGDLITGVEVNGGEVIQAKRVLSSAGYPETMMLANSSKLPPLGPLTFTEGIFVFDKKIPLTQQEATIIFHNSTSSYRYKSSQDIVDTESAVICFPDHYEPEIADGEGMIRVTYISQYQKWKNLDKEQYEMTKDSIKSSALNLALKYCPGFDGKLRFSDLFTPLTIERYTWHKNGTVYGSTEKSKEGLTPFKNLFLIGTDQGFLGIIGSMLSGISISNLHVLMSEQT